MDGVTIPFDIGGKDPFVYWRNEALKAYGNAIVPQVMYEIFRAIEQVEQMSNPI
jgi:DNA (cytosine-5)-methyltransferase 1